MHAMRSRATIVCSAHKCLSLTPAFLHADRLHLSACSKLGDGGADTREFVSLAQISNTPGRVQGPPNPIDPDS
jgi:hypothetical protein